MCRFPRGSAARHQYYNGKAGLTKMGALAAVCVPGAARGHDETVV
jgi:hypothetical protein